MRLEWYYARGEELSGPVDDAELESLVSSGTIGADTLVWREGMADWQPYGTVAQVSVAAPDEIPPSIFGETGSEICAECGRPFPDSEMVSYEQHWVCADCKDVFFQRVREGGTRAGDLRYAGFWLRFCARFIDWIIVNFAIYAVAFGVGGAASSSGSAEPGAMEVILVLGMVFSTFGFPMAYETYFIGKHGATPGKMVFGLRVVMSDGSPLTYGRAFGRFFGYVLSRITLYIGCIIAAFDDQKRSLHDHICDTRVVFK